MKINQKKVFLHLKTFFKFLIITMILIAVIIYIESLSWAVFWIIRIVYPFVIGAAIAFVINIPMTYIETKLLPENFKSKRTVALLLSVAIVLGLIILIAVLIIPKFVDSVFELKNKVPEFYRYLAFKMDEHEWLAPISEKIRENYTSRDFTLGFEQIINFFKRWKPKYCAYGL